MDYQTNQCNGSLTKVTSEDLTELCVTLYDILSITLHYIWLLHCIAGVSAPVTAVGIAGVGVAGGSLLLLLGVVCVTTLSPFYQHHAYGDEAAWALSDYIHVLK